MKPLKESDLLKPGLPKIGWPHLRLNKIHRCVLPQIYGESENILRANPPVWKKPHNRQVALRVESMLFQPPPQNPN